MIIIESKRLILRKFQASDSETLLGIFADINVMHFDYDIHDLAWIEAWILRQQNCYQKFGYGNWAVISKDNNKFIGYCGLNYMEDICGQTEVSIGYRLIHESWGHGYATEIVKAVIDYSFKELNLKRIVATIDPSNVASSNVAKKAAMRYEKDVMLEGYTYADHLFVIERDT